MKKLHQSEQILRHFAKIKPAPLCYNFLNRFHIFVNLGFMLSWYLQHYFKKAVV